MDLLELFISASMVPINFSAQLKTFIDTMAAGRETPLCLPLP
jgi:FMN-dependent NADH-azoreductase